MRDYRTPAPVDKRRAAPRHPSNGQASAPQPVAPRRPAPPWLLPVVLVVLVMGVVALALVLARPPKPRAAPPANEPATPSPVPPSFVRTLPTNALVAPLLTQVDEARIGRTVEQLAAFGTRHTNAFDQGASRGIDAARRWVSDTLRQYSSEAGNVLEVRDVPFSATVAGVRSTQHNVLAMLTGKNPARRFIISAHLDTRGDPRSTQNAAPEAPGANDDASGVALVLEVARLLSQHVARTGQLLDATLVFAIFSAEEQDRQGSINYVGRLEANLSIEGVFSFDVIGGISGDTGALNAGGIRLFSPDHGPSRQLSRYAKLLVEHYLPSYRFSLLPFLDRADRYSDHVSFYQQGYPVGRFTELNENAKLQHTPQDLPSSVSAANVAQLTKATVVILLNYATAPGRPAPPRAFATGQELRLLWSPVPGASHYLLAAREASSTAITDFTLINGETQLSLPLPQGEYFLSLAALNDSGAVSLLSEEVALGRQQ
ncbi:MAG: M20/M25/M40 family metallo-hydrolase [Deinococcus sp.]|nr:M20/M25/M40 family metallo-hydrolase [Deinococcus sp.]